jgi:hypothetical protein
MKILGVRSLINTFLSAKETAMSTGGKQIALVTFVLFAVSIISCSGGGGGIGPTGGGTTAGYDGVYNCTGTTTTPAGTSPPAAGSFSCSNGYCSEPSGAFSGNVDGNGHFTGTDKICSTCNPLPMSGQFSLTNVFAIHGSSGSVSATFNCRHSGASSGGGGGGGGTPGPTITSFTPPSGSPGTPVNLVGTNFPTFVSDVHITVCGVPATILSATSTEIFFLMPDVSGTSCALILTTSGGTVTASNTISVTALVLAPGTFVYWTEDGPYVGLVRRVGINGGTITSISPALGGPGNIAVTSNGIFWIEDGSRALDSGAIRKVSLNGGSVTTLVTGLNNSPNMTVDSTNVYWTESFNLGSVQKVGINGGSPSTIATGSDVNMADGIAVDSSSVYWVDFGSGSVKKRGISGGSVITLVSGRSYPNRIAVDSTSVYWTENGSAAGGAVMKCSNSFAGGPTTTLASGLSSPWSITVDANYVYWSEYIPNGRIMKVANTGGAVTTLASGLNSPKGIAVDSTSVYWAEEGAKAIRKVALVSGITSTIASGIGYPAYVAVYPH